MNTILNLVRFRDRDYAIFYTDPSGIPRVEYRLGKNHEAHAINGFVKERHELGEQVQDGRSHDRIEVYVGGKRVFDTLEGSN